MKRLFDTVSAAMLLMLLGPLMLIIAALVYRRLGSPVIFKQQRPGRHMKPFYIYKFRTMTDARSPQGELLPDEERMTAFGLFLRKYSLDELPQLLNVCLGHMSLVGPRPLLMRYLPYFNEREKIRFRVRPGITGLAQISGRNDLPWNLRLELDVVYVENRSFLLDMSILLKTAGKVLRRENVADIPRMAMTDLDIERGG